MCAQPHRDALIALSSSSRRLLVSQVNQKNSNVKITKQTSSAQPQPFPNRAEYISTATIQDALKAFSKYSRPTSAKTLSEKDKSRVKTSIERERREHKGKTGVGLGLRASTLSTANGQSHRRKKQKTSQVTKETCAKTFRQRRLRGRQALAPQSQAMSQKGQINLSLG